MRLTLGANSADWPRRHWRARCCRERLGCGAAVRHAGWRDRRPQSHRWGAVEIPHGPEWHLQPAGGVSSAIARAAHCAWPNPESVDPTPSLRNHPSRMAVPVGPLSELAMRRFGLDPPYGVYRVSRFGAPTVVFTVSEATATTVNKKQLGTWSTSVPAIAVAGVARP